MKLCIGSENCIVIDQIVAEFHYQKKKKSQKSQILPPVPP